MKLIEFDGADFRIADEALLVRQIRELFLKDRSKGKEDFWKQISYLWFMCDPRSSYQYITDEDERSKEIIHQEGLGDSWSPSATLSAAMDVYRKQTVTTASLLLEDMRKGIEDLRYTLRIMGESVRAVNDDGSPKRGSMALDKALTSMTKTIKEIPELAKALVEAEKALAKDFTDEDKARGNVTKAIGEDI